MIVQPGDTLIICCSERITVEQAAEIKRVIADRLDGLADVIIIPAVQVAAYRPR